MILVSDGASARCSGYFWPMPLMLRSALCPLLLCTLFAVRAQGPVQWEAGLEQDGAVWQVRLKAACEAGWHIYALELPRDDGPLPTVVRLLADDAYTATGSVIEPAAEEVEDPNFGMAVRYHSDNVVFGLPFERNSSSAFVVRGEVEYMACNDRTCLPPRTVPFTVSVPSLE